jgi:2-dehydropantoate 2-reductase
VAAPDAGERFDVIVILVKSQHTRDAAASARSLLADDGVVVSFQNGLGNEEAIGEVVGLERVIGGTLYFGGNVVAPGRVSQSNSRGGIAIGVFSPAAEPAAKRISQALIEAGFATRVEKDVMALKWQKVLVNIGVNAMSTICNQANRVAGDRPEIRVAMIAICEEAIAVAKAKGITLVGGEVAAEYVRQGTDVHSYEHKSSMTLDLAAGRKTEVDVMNGAIERFGREVGVRTPLNTIAYAAIRRIEQEKAFV